jgi:enoyl-CoA hydratase
MDYQYILFTKEEGLARLQINRPQKLNALNMDVYREIEDVVVICEAAPDVKVLLITGNDKAFAAGADIDLMADGDIVTAQELTDLSRRVQERLADVPKPTIAALAGYCLGGGLELALCCDLRIGAENAVFGLPEINLGIIPGGGGTQRLARLIGVARATEMIFLGEMVKIEEALHLGIVNRVVPLERLEEEARELARKLMAKPPIALRSAKTAIRNGLSMGLKEGIRAEQDAFALLFGTKDQKEGMAAFIEKRKPKFIGR